MDYHCQCWTPAHLECVVRIRLWSQNKMFDSNAVVISPSSPGTDNSGNQKASLCKKNPGSCKRRAENYCKY